MRTTPCSCVEPRVTTSEIWVTREFKEQLEDRPSLYGAVPLRPPQTGEGADTTHFNVKKPDSDGRDILVELFRVGPRR